MTRINKMFGILFIIWLFSEVMSSEAAPAPSPIKPVEWYNREDITQNDTIPDELIDSGRVLIANFSIPMAELSSTIISSTLSPDISDALNKTQNSITFRVSKIFEYSALSWLKNDYVMSIVIPISAGIGCGLLLIILVNLWRCARVRCQRCCHKKNRNLPKHIKQLKLADRMKLLAESSDEEF